MVRTKLRKQYRDNCETTHTFYWEKLISSYCFLNKYSKELFDYGVGIHRRKEDFLPKKRCNLPFELNKGMSKIIITVRKYISDQFGKAIISVISSKKVVIFGGSLLLAFANTCEILSLLSKGRCFQ